MDWQNWWAVEYQPGPSNRLRYWQQLLTCYHALHRQNIAIDIVAPDSDLSTYRLVVAPLLYMLRPGIAQNLEQFVASGGTLLVTFFSGIVDQHNHAQANGYPGELRNLLGIHVAELDPWTPEMSNTVIVKEGPLAGSYPCTLWGEVVRLEGARALGVFAEDYYAGQPALTVNQFGQGRAYYLATQASDELLAGLMQQLCREADIAPILRAPEGVEVTQRVRSDGRSLYFLLNHSERALNVALPSGAFTSLLDGKNVTGEVTIPPVDVMVLLELQ